MKLTWTLSPSVLFMRIALETWSKPWFQLISIKQFMTLPSRNQLNFFTNSRHNPTDQIFVFFSDERSVGVKTMRKCAFQLFDHQIVSVRHTQTSGYPGGKVYPTRYHRIPRKYDTLGTKSECMSFEALTPV